MHKLVPLLAVCLLLGGCTAPPTTDPGTTDDPVPEFRFDGAGAYAYVEGLVTDENGTDRPRVPGTPQHAAAADWLEETMRMPGWTVERQSFTGAQYKQLDKGRVTNYATHPAYCLPADQRTLDNTTFHNLVGTWSSGAAAAGHVLLAAHWDSKEEASSEQSIENSSKAVVGANDGGSGVGVLVRLMEHVAAGDIDPSVGRLTVVFVDGEDGFEDCHPLAGSLYHAQSLDGHPDAMVLLDMVGDPVARFPRESYSMESASWLVDALWAHGREAGLEENLLDTQKAVFDDHIAYLEQGIPSVDVIDAGRPASATSHGFPPYWHTTKDTMDNIDPDMLGRVGDMVARLLADPSLPDLLRQHADGQRPADEGAETDSTPGPTGTDGPEA